jgi:hypothetical protein
MSPRTLSSIYLEVDGKPVKASDLCWIVRAKCGCIDGAMTVDRGDGDVLFTAELARSSMNQGIKAIIDRSIEDGEVYTLITWDQYRAEEMGCTHDPKWGIVKVAAPAGHVWATTDRWSHGRRTHKRHIVPEGALMDYGVQHAALCGTKPTRIAPPWSVDQNNLSDTVTCRRCETAAAAVRP